MSGTIGTNSGRGSGTIGTASAGVDTDLSNLSATGETLACQAWVNINHVTSAITDSGGINGFSSMTDHATGSLTVTFTEAMANATYSVTGSNIGSSSSLQYSCVMTSGGATGTTTTFRVDVINYGDHNGRDMDKVSLMVFGD